MMIAGISVTAAHINGHKLFEFARLKLGKVVTYRTLHGLIDRDLFVLQFSKGASADPPHHHRIHTATAQGL